MKKTPIALAMAAMAGVGGSLISTSAYAVNMAERDIGDALIFPYYTARDGWATLFNITNASADTVALKVRFRESYNSRDVLDFNVVMSPYDVWTGWVSEGPNGPRMYSTDLSCTSPLLNSEGDTPYFDFTDIGYSGTNSDGGPEGIDRAYEGHMEVLMMGALPAGLEGTRDDNSDLVFPTAYYANHDNLDCAQVDANFLAGSAPPFSLLGAIIDDLPPPGPIGPGDICFFGDSDESDGNPRAECDFWRNSNALKGNFSLIDTAGGIGAGGEATTLANYRTGWNLNVPLPLFNITAQCSTFFEVPELWPGQECDISQDQSNTIIAKLTSKYTNAVTAQQSPFFLEPTLDSADPIAPLTVDNPPIFLGIPELAASIIGLPLGDILADCDSDGPCAYLGIGNLRFGRGVDAVSFALREANLINEWSTNLNTGASTDWAVTFPTKSFYVDADDNVNAGINPDRYGCTPGTPVWTDCDFNSDGFVDHPAYNPNTPLPWVFDVTATVAAAETDGGDGPLSTIDIHPAIHMELFSEVFDGQSCDEVVYNLWDREEGGARSGGTSISPAPPQPTDSLCYETNILAFGDQDSALGSNLAQGVDVSVLSSGAPFGWMRLDQVPALDEWLSGVGPDVIEYHECLEGDVPEECGFLVLPKMFSAGVGFAFKQRDFGDATRNYGQLMDHSAPKPLEQLIMDGILDGGGINGGVSNVDITAELAQP